MADGPAKHRSRKVLDLIAFFKFVKALTLVAAGLGGLGLLNARVASWAELWLERLALGHGHRLFARAAEVALPVLMREDARHLELLSAGAFAYAAVFVVEGVGLIRERRWAEYLTIAVTASFLPFEAMALAHHVSLMRAGTLVTNVAVVAYLVWRIRTDRRAGREVADVAAQPPR